MRLPLKLKVKTNFIEVAMARPHGWYTAGRLASSV